MTTPTRNDILASARLWLGTPYHHQTSLLGVGTDCLGLIRGIWRDLYGCEPQTMPAYTRDWAEASGEETLLDTASRHLVAIDPAAAAPGDILAFRYRPGIPAKHLGILSGGILSSGRLSPTAIGSPATMIHASESGPVCEITLTPWWQRRIASAFTFPDIVDS